MIRIRRLLSGVATCLMLFSLFFSIGVSSSAAVKYDPDAALEYAAQHWNESGPCATFVSECLYQGGISYSYQNGSPIASSSRLWNALPISEFPRTS